VGRGGTTPHRLLRPPPLEKELCLAELPITSRPAGPQELFLTSTSLHSTPSRANRRHRHPSVTDARAHSASPLPPVELVLLLPLEFPSESKAHGNSVCSISEYPVINLMNLLSNLMHSVKFYQRSLFLGFTERMMVIIVL
jgi:hypothetical protein